MLAAREKLGVDDPLGLWRQRQQHDDDVGRGHQIGERVALAAPDADDVRAEGLQAGPHRAADRAVAEDQHGRAVKVGERGDRRGAGRREGVDVSLPVPRALDVEELVQAPAEGEDHHHDPFGDADVVRSRRGAHDHPGRGDRQDHVRAGEHRLHHPYGRQLRDQSGEPAHQLDAQHDELHPVVGLGDQLDLRGELAQLLPQRSLGDEYAHARESNAADVAGLTLGATAG